MLARVWLVMLLLGIASPAFAQSLRPSSPPDSGGVGLPVSSRPKASTSASFLVAQEEGEGSGSQSTMGQPDGSGGGSASENNGTNPAQNATTFIVSNEYYTLRGGNRINVTYARFKYPWCEKQGALVFEVPYVYYNLQATFPNLPQIGGLGDVRIQGSYNTWTSDDKRLTLINFLEIFLPSADNAIVTRGPGGNELTAFNLGTGKYVLGPGVGFVYAIQPNFIFAPLYFYEASAFGSSNRPDIRRGKWRVFAM